MSAVFTDLFSELMNRFDVQYIGFIGLRHVIFIREMATGNFAIMRVPEMNKEVAVKIDGLSEEEKSEIERLHGIKVIKDLESDQ